MNHDKLASLHTAIIDARAGYGKAIEQAEDPGVLERLRAVAALHQSAHADIHRMLGSQGETPDDDGSLMGSLHKAVVTTRSAILGLDDASLASFASGEETNLKAYDEAIAEMVEPSQRAVLQEHRDALAAEVTATKHKAETAGTTII
jgi:uncharacterized protein (TIGR02284 family)